jgi:hypothetical protein
MANKITDGPRRPMRLGPSPSMRPRPRRVRAGGMVGRLDLVADAW